MVEATANQAGATPIELLRRAREGDAEAFCQLAQPCEAKLYQQAFALCRNAASAEDLASETLVEAWKSLGRFNGGCRFSTWLYAILVHRAQKLFRTASRQPFLFDPTPSADDPASADRLLENVQDAHSLPDETLLENELSSHLRAVVKKLPREHQQVLLLRFYQDASLAEIAAALDLPLGTVKSRLHHALQKMRSSKDLLNLLEPGRDTKI